MAEIINNERAHRFETTVEGHRAVLVYERDAERLVLVHTGVPPQLEGKGIGGLLVSAALDLALADGLTVEPLCPFARGWMERHPDTTARIPVKW